MLGDKEKYVRFISTRDDMRIYNMPFWLDAVCGKNNWDAVVIEENGEVVAALPYHRKKRFCINGVLQPQLTQCFDIWIKPLKGLKTERALHYRFKWIGEIAKRLSDLGADFYDMELSGSLRNGEPFAWKGFRQEVRYSFIIPPGQRSEDVLSQMDRAGRAMIRKASGTVRLEELRSPEQLYKIISASFERRGMKNPNPEVVYKRLYKACRAHGACKMAAVKDAQGDICCAGLYVFDKNYVYELLVGTVPGKRSENLKAFMTYEMIKFACETGRGFDFEGSMIPSIAEHNRRFGAEPVQYYRLWKIQTKKLLKKAVLDRLCNKS